MSKAITITQEQRATRNEMAHASQEIARTMRTIAIQLGRLRTKALGTAPMSNKELTALGRTYEKVAIKVQQISELCGKNPAWIA